jgi:two-component system copper resistance phosphate regulon response regulator CusR
MRLLVVEDEARIASFLVKGLSDQGYSVECVATGAQALERGSDPELDLVILDLGLADMDGLEVLRALRTKGRWLPVIIVTARGEVEDRVEGLNVGADDYLTKPFAFEELLARVRARLRSHNGDPMHLDAGGVRLDPRARRAEVAGEAVELTDREYALLEMLLQRPGETVSRAHLLSHVWGLTYDPGTNIVDVYVGDLRRKVGEARIEAVGNGGYRFAADPEPER